GLIGALHPHRGVLVDGDGDLLQRVVGVVDLARLEDRVAGGLGDVVVLDGDVGGGHRGQLGLLVAGVDGAGGGVHQEQGEGALHGVALGADRHVVPGGVVGLDHRVGDDRVHRLLLGAAGAV